MADHFSSHRRLRWGQHFWFYAFGLGSGAIVLLVIIYSESISSQLLEVSHGKVASSTLLVEPTCSIDCAGQLLIDGRIKPHIFVANSRGVTTRLKNVQAGIGIFALVDPTSFLIAVAEGAPLVAIWANTQADTRAFFVSQGSDIWTAEQFLDKRLAVKTDLRLAFEAVMARNGLPRSRVTVRLSSDPFQTMTDGDADFAYGDTLQATQRLANSVDTWREIELSSLGIHFPGDVIVTSEETANTYPGLVGALVVASAEGWADVFADPLRAIQIFARRAPDFDLKIAAQAVDRRRALVSPLGARVGELQPHRFEELAQALRRDGRISVAFDFSRILRREFVDELYRSVLHRRTDLTSTSR